MARTLKVFRYTLASYREEAARLGQPSHIRQMNAIVAVTTKREAIEKFGITSSEANNFLGQTGNHADIAKAMSKPGQVFAYALNDYKEADRKYIEVERAPHVPIKRAKRVPIDVRMAMFDQQRREREAREFTREELEYLVDMFDGANNPVAASIAAKAKLSLS